MKNSGKLKKWTKKHKTKKNYLKKHRQNKRKQRKRKKERKKREKERERKVTLPTHPISNDFSHVVYLFFLQYLLTTIHLHLLIFFVKLTFALSVRKIKIMCKYTKNQGRNRTRRISSNNAI